MQYPPRINALKPFFISNIPLLVHNSKRNVLVGRTGFKSDNAKLWIIGGTQNIVRSDCFIDQLLKEDIELVALHCFGRRVVQIVVRAVVNVPIVAGFNSVEKLRTTGFVFVHPVVILLRNC